MEKKVLSLSLRPQKLDDIIGQEDIVNQLKNQFGSKRIPGFFLISGETGTGKCLGYNTGILMFDGTIKKVQDIKVGEQVMGDDSKPRNILSTTKGKEKMYKIQQSNGEDYVVNASHILSLRILDTEDIIDIPVKHYLCLPDHVKKLLRGYKVPVQFKKKELPLDPYTFGRLMALNL